jgi:hypothetical protein
MGRRTHMSTRQEKKLAQPVSNSARIDVMTFDDLLQPGQDRLRQPPSSAHVVSVECSDDSPSGTTPAFGWCVTFGKRSVPARRPLRPHPLGDGRVRCRNRGCPVSRIASTRLTRAQRPGAFAPGGPRRRGDEVAVGGLVAPGALHPDRPRAQRGPQLRQQDSSHWRRSSRSIAARTESSSRGLRQTASLNLSRGIVRSTNCDSNPRG